MSFELLLITDPRWSMHRVLDVAQAAGEALGGRFAVQVRDRDAPPAALAHALRAVTRTTGSRLYVNRWTDLANEIGADGVHGVIADRPFTMPAHDEDELATAIDAGAEAVLVSPIFETPGKGPAKGVAFLERARALTPRRVRLVALGGITAETAAACRAAGADAIAVMRALLDAAHPSEEALRLAGDGVG